MSDDENRFELMERRLTEAVEEKVRSRLFKVYGIIGGAILTILGFVGYDGIKDIREIAVEAAKQEASEQVDPVVDEARKALDAARQQANDAQLNLKLASERLADVADRLARGELQIEGFGKQISKASAQIKQAELRLNQTAAEIENQQKRARDTFAGAGTLSDLAQQVSALNIQVKEIARMADITTAASGASEAELEKVRTGTVQTVPAATAKSTVFFQFAQLPREQAQEIVGALRSRGYTVPGEDREDAAANLREVRFFFDEDKAAADKLVADTREMLAGLGFGDIPIKARNVVDYGGQKPRRGVLELWLDLAPL